MKGFRIVNRNVLLDNNETYRIAYSIDMSDSTVYYMINVHDFSDIKFCYVVGDDEFEEIRDKEQLKTIIAALNKNVNLFIR